MSDATTHLLLPHPGGAAQKHVTHNEALRILDGLVQLSVSDRDLTAPPGSRRWRSLHRRLRRDGRLGRMGPERRALDRWRLAATSAADRLAGMGRGRGPAAGLRRRGLARDHTGGAAEHGARSGLAPRRMHRTRSRPSSTPRSGRRDRRRGRHRRSVLHHEQGGGGRRSRLTLQTGFVTKALVGLFGSGPLRLAVSADAAAPSSTGSRRQRHRHCRSAPAAAVQGLHELRQLRRRRHLDEDRP